MQLQHFFNSLWLRSCDNAIFLARVFVFAKCRTEVARACSLFRLCCCPERMYLQCFGVNFFLLNNALDKNVIYSKIKLLSKLEKFARNSYSTAFGVSGCGEKHTKILPKSTYQKIIKLEREGKKGDFRIVTLYLPGYFYSLFVQRDTNPIYLKTVC